MTEEDEPTKEEIRNHVRGGGLNIGDARDRELSPSDSISSGPQPLQRQSPLLNDGPQLGSSRSDVVDAIRAIESVEEQLSDIDECSEVRQKLTKARADLVTALLEEEF